MGVGGLEEGRRAEDEIRGQLTQGLAGGRPLLEVKQGAQVLTEI